MKSHQNKFTHFKSEFANDMKFNTINTQDMVSSQNTRNQFTKTKVYHVENRLSNDNIGISYENQQTTNTFPSTIENMYTKTNSKDKIDNSNRKTKPKRRKFIIKYYGNVLTIYYTHEITKYNEPIIVIGPQWYVFLFGFIIFTAFECFIYSILWEKSKGVLYFVGCIINLVQLVTYLFLFLSNPGIVVRPANKDEAMCRYCQCVKYVNQHQRHCQICDACFLNLDHHCPWTSKCVGYRNVFLFRAFIGFTMMMFMWLVVIIITSN